jgi:hypothetical protein
MGLYITEGCFRTIMHLNNSNITIRPKQSCVLLVFLKFTLVMLFVEGGSLNSYLIICLRLYHVLCKYQFIICLGMIIAQLAFGYNVRKINFTIIKNRCLVMCKVCSFCLTRARNWSDWCHSRSGTQIGQTDVITGLTGSSISSSTFLGSRVGDSDIIPPEKDETELQVLMGHNFD